MLGRVTDHLEIKFLGLGQRRRRKWMMRRVDHPRLAQMADLTLNRCGRTAVPTARIRRQNQNSFG